MKATEVLERAFAMPLTQPAYPPGPYRFYDREFLIITYRTDREKLREIVPGAARDRLGPGEVRIHPNAEFNRLRRLYGGGAGDPCQVRSADGKLHALNMFLNDHSPIAAGRELWGFPKKLAGPTLRVETDTLVGTLDYGPVRVATGTMGFKHKQADAAATLRELVRPQFPAQAHPARGRHAAHLRARRIPPRGDRPKGRVERPRRPVATRPCACACRGSAGA